MRVNPEILCGRLLSHEKHNGHEECDVRRRLKKRAVFSVLPPSLLAGVNPGQAAVCVWTSQHTDRHDGRRGDQLRKKKWGKKLGGKAVDRPNNEQQTRARGLVCPLHTPLSEAALGSLGAGDL